MKEELTILAQRYGALGAVVSGIENLITTITDHGSSSGIGSGAGKVSGTGSGTKSSGGRIR